MGFRRRWLLILLASILGGGPLFAATREQSAYAAALADFRSQQWDRAEMDFAQFQQKYPKSTNAPEAVLLQAQAAFKQEKPAVTIALLADPNHLAKAGALADQYVYWTGEAQCQNGELPNAAETFVSLARRYPESSLRLPAVVSAASAYAGLGQWRHHDALLEDTNGVFQLTAREDPGNELVLEGRLSLENSKYQQRDFGGVTAVYDQLTNQWPLLNQVQQCQGDYLLYRAKMELGEFIAALAVTTNLVRIASSPTNQDWLATGWASQGEALERLGRLPKAIAAWRNNLTNAPPRLQREAILKIAEQEIIQGQLTNAEATLTNFLAQFTETNVADIALLTAGELHLKDYAAQPAATNELSAAESCFNQFLNTFTNSPLLGKAYLDRGWCQWLAGDTSNSLADFEQAALWLPRSVDLAVARFKMGDALLALTNAAGALTNYRAVLDDFTNFPAVAGTLGDRALYQSLCANLQLTNYEGASNDLTQILNQYPTNDLAAAGELLYGQSLAETITNPSQAAARGVFETFEQRFPNSPLRPRVAFAIARTYDAERQWPAALGAYQDWLKDFPTNDLRPKVDYARALANAESGNDTNALALFSRFVAEFPANEQLTPRARWWLADYFYGLGGTNYVDAERNYKLIYQNFPTNGLAYPAKMMAGRAAMGRQDNSGAIRNYFGPMEVDTNCDIDLRVQAAFANGDALMRMDSTVTNDLLANFSMATNVFASIIQQNPTNDATARAWGCLGECYFQLADYAAATNAYAQVLNTNLAANVSVRSQAQIGIGLALEKMAAALTGTNQTAVLRQARDNYLDVFDTWTGQNLRPGETADPHWVAEAGWQALHLIEKLGTTDPNKFIDQMEAVLPQLKSSLEKARASLSPPKS
jgi:TolA-binding protein